MPPRRKFAVVAATERERAPDLRIAVNDALNGMDWLSDSDDALKTLAMRAAEEIETTIDRAEELDAVWHAARGEPGGTEIYKRLQRLEAMCEVPKVLATLGPHLLAVLRELGGTPEARGALKKDKPVGSRLAQLRDAAGKTD